MVEEILAARDISVTHDQIANVFTRRLTQDTATKFHTARSRAFATWAEVTGVALAA